MKTPDNSVLITGGGTGIGLALTEAFSREGTQIIISGRQKEKLRLAEAMFPEIHIMESDVARVEDCQALFNRVTTEFPKLNILVNNAAIRRQVDFTKGSEDLDNGEDEYEITMGQSQGLRTRNQRDAEQIFQRMNGNW
jgi:uncharacterized oxidoreductase